MKQTLFLFLIFILASCSKDTTTTPTANEPIFYMNVPYNVTPHSVDLSWTGYAETDFTKYEVFASLVAGFKSDTAHALKVITDKKLTSITVDSLMDETTYYFRVRVVKTDGTKKSSKQESAITAEEAKITVGSPFNVTYQSIDLIWKKYTKSDFNRYEVHRSLSSGFEPTAGTLFDTYNQSKDSTRIDNLSHNTKYYFKVRLVLDGNKTYDSEERSATTWALFFNRFEDAQGEIYDSLILVRDPDDPPDPTDSSSYLQSSGFTFNSLNLLNFRTIKVEFTMKANTTIYQAVNRTSANFYTAPADTLPSSSAKKFVKYIYDYQMLSADQMDLTFDYEAGLSASGYLYIYEVAVSGERLINGKKDAGGTNDAPKPILVTKKKSGGR